MTAKSLVIGSHIKLAFDGINSARKLGPSDRQSPMILFYAIENLVMATLTSEDIPRSVWRAKAGNHQLDRMIDSLPAECTIVHELENFAPLTQFSTGYRYPSASGRVPKQPGHDLMQNWLEQSSDLVQVFVRHFKADLWSDPVKAGSIAPFRSKDHDEFEP